MSVGRSWVAVSVAVSGVVLGWAEWMTWKVSRDALPTGATDSRRVASGESVLVLGCPLGIVQHWRVRIALRSTDPDRARFVFSGGAVRGPISEAQLMADYAVHELGVPAGNVVVEYQSRTTVENVVNSLPLIADSPSIKIASNTFHARRARQILGDESPDLAGRLVRARDYVPMEWGPLHAALVVIEGYRVRRARSSMAAISRKSGNTVPHSLKGRLVAIAMETNT